jgi:hypothetical protein
MTATATRLPASGGTTNSIPVVATLGRFEGRQMVRHPLFWVAAAATIGLSAFELIEEAPVLNRVSMTLAWTMAPMAVAVAFLAGWAVLRARGRTDADPPMVMPAPMRQRVAGVVVGLLWPASATLALQLVLLAWTAFRNPVTSVVWTELLVGPLFVALAGALSALTTRWISHPSAPLVALALLAGVQIAVPYSPENWGSRIGPAALAPIAWPETIIPYEVALRPSGLHLGYLAGLVLVVSGLAMAGRARAPWIVLGVGVVLAGVLGQAQLGPIDESKRNEAMAQLVGDEAELTCETYDPVTYCAMPGYGGWIDTWRLAAEPIIERVPGESVPIEVRQYPVHNTHLLDGQDYNYWWWIPPSYQDYISRDVVPVGSVLADYTLSIDLTDKLASRLIGCDPTCEGEAQQLVHLWLLAENPQVAANIEYDTSPESDYAHVASCMVADLWQLTDETTRVQGNWSVLTDPATTYQQAGELLGISVPTPTEGFGGIDGGCP